MLISCLTSSNLKMEATCFPETSIVFSGLHRVTPQKTKFFISTNMRTSNLATDRVGHDVRERRECTSKQNNREILSRVSSFAGNPTAGATYWATRAVMPTKMAQKVTTFDFFSAICRGFKISRDTDISYSFFGGYSHFFEVNVEMKPQIRPRPLLSTSSIHYSVMILQFQALIRSPDSVAKRTTDCCDNKYNGMPLFHPKRNLLGTERSGSGGQATLSMYPDWNFM